MILKMLWELLKQIANPTKVITFVKENNKWYAKVPLIYEYFKPRTEMVFGANRLLDVISTNGTVTVTTKGDDIVLDRVKWALFNGAFYKVTLNNGVFKELIWICPVTLFVYGYYPKQIKLSIVKNK